MSYPESGSRTEGVNSIDKYEALFGTLKKKGGYRTAKNSWGPEGTNPSRVTRTQVRVWPLICTTMLKGMGDLSWASVADDSYPLDKIAAATDPPSLGVPA